MTQTLNILDKLVAYPSVSANSNLDIIEYIHDFLSNRGFTLHNISSPCGKKAGLYAVLGPSDKPGIMLSGHTDVVPTSGQQWSVEPFTMSRSGDRIYGRGTTDMKGYLASMLALADKASNIALKEPIKLALSYDEEVGCVGIQHMINQLESTIGLPRVCFVGEPTQMQVAVGHKGKVALRATCIGQSGHSALAPKFVNALHIAGDFMAGLRSLQEELATQGHQDTAFDIPYSTVHIGKLEGGIALNIVPDKAILTFEYRHIVADASESLMSRIEFIAEQSLTPYKERFSGSDIAIEQYNAYPGLDVSATDEAVILAQSFSQTENTIKVAFGTEAGVFNQLGIPTVVCGPGSMQGQGHKPDEYIELDQLDACDAMMHRILNAIKA